jgi:hypothetical protein
LGGNNTCAMNKRFYWLVRDLHLYLGLFISPFILVFSISVFFLVHTGIPRFGSQAANTRVVSGLVLPANLQQLSGPPLIEALKLILEKMNVTGEIGYVRHLVQEDKLLVPVSIPGRATTVTLTLAKREASVVTRETGLAEAMITLHKTPGQHTPDLRMNWIFMKAWRWLADATVYLTLFISISGIYLWYVLRAERRIGWILLGAGTVTFFGIVYAISH